jgi:hypothetical protein
MTGTFWFSEWLGPEFATVIFGIGGAFVSSLSTFPVREIMNRRDKIEILKILLNALGKTVDAANEDEMKRINDLIWQIMKKIAVG